MTTAEAAAAPGEGTAQVWAPGSAVVCLGHDDAGAESLAVWQVSTAGAPTGAWVKALSDAFEPDTARQLLTLVERRALADSGEAGLADVLVRLGRAGGLPDPGWWRGQVFDPAEAFRATVRRRAELEATVRGEAEASKTITPLEWAHDLGEDGDGIATFGDLQRVAGIRTADGAPVVAAALTATRVLRWLVALWAETEQVKNRRHYVRDAHGPAEALPPSWLAAVRTAGATRLPL